MLQTLRQIGQSGFAGTVGAASGAYDLMKKYVPGSDTRRDLSDGKVRNLARAAIVLDAASIVIQTSGPTLRRVFSHHLIGKTVSGVSHAGHFNRVAGTVSFVLQIGAGVLEFEIACRQKDSVRASNAVGSTVGGLAGGFVCAAIAGVPGAVAGSWGGQKIGQYCTNGVVREWLQNKIS